MNTAIEDRIRSRAYELWEAEGRPEGREIDHWLRAVQELAEQRPTVAGAPARRTRSTASSTATKAKSASATRTAERRRTTKGTASVS